MIQIQILIIKKEKKEKPKEVKKTKKSDSDNSDSEYEDQVVRAKKMQPKKKESIDDDE